MCSYDSNILNTPIIEQPKQSLTKHGTDLVSTHSSQLPFECKHCAKRFNRRSILCDHERIHTGERPYACAECNKTYVNNSTLTIHKRIHSGERPYVCTKCEKKYMSKTALNSHDKHCHSRKRPYSCTTCDKRFINMQGLCIHERCHSGERPYACIQCDKTFIHSSNLHKHEQIHIGVQLYSCTQCDKSYGYLSSLRKHEKYCHTDDRSYVCTICDKKCHSSSHLLVHERNHTGERPYACVQCDKRFNDISNMRRHVKFHNHQQHAYVYTQDGESQSIAKSNLHSRYKSDRLYACTLCYKTFKQNVYLKKHEKTHTGEQRCRYVCVNCDKKYYTSYSLRIHVRRSHSLSLSLAPPTTTVTQYLSLTLAPPTTTARAIQERKDGGEKERSDHVYNVCSEDWNVLYNRLDNVLCTSCCTSILYSVHHVGHLYFTVHIMLYIYTVLCTSCYTSILYSGVSRMFQRGRGQCRKTETKTFYGPTKKCIATTWPNHLKNPKKSIPKGDRGHCPNCSKNLKGKGGASPNFLSSKYATNTVHLVHL